MRLRLLVTLGALAGASVLWSFACVSDLPAGQDAGPDTGVTDSGPPPPQLTCKEVSPSTRRTLATVRLTTGHMWMVTRAAAPNRTQLVVPDIVADPDGGPDTRVTRTFSFDITSQTWAVANATFKDMTPLAVERASNALIAAVLDEQTGDVWIYKLPDGSNTWDTSFKALTKAFIPNAPMGKRSCRGTVVVRAIDATANDYFLVVSDVTADACQPPFDPPVLSVARTKGATANLVPVKPPLLGNAPPQAYDQSHDTIAFDGPNRAWFVVSPNYENKGPGSNTTFYSVDLAAMTVSDPKPVVTDMVNDLLYPAAFSASATAGQFDFAAIGGVGMSPGMYVGQAAFTELAAFKPRTLPGLALKSTDDLPISHGGSHWEIFPNNGLSNENLLASAAPPGGGAIFYWATEKGASIAKFDSANRVLKDVPAFTNVEANLLGAPIVQPGIRFGDLVFGWVTPDADGGDTGAVQVERIHCAN